MQVPDIELMTVTNPPQCVYSRRSKRMAVSSSYLPVLLALGALVRYSGAACSYTEIQLKRGSSVDLLDYIPSVDIQGCKDACSADKLCLGADFNTVDNGCFLLNKMPTAPYKDEANFVHLEKTCVSAPCSMTRTADKKGGTTKVQLSLTSADQCSSNCLYMIECQGVKYSGGSCSIYTGPSLASNTGDNLTHVKQACSSGMPCCMTETSTLKASEAAIMVLASSIDSCETLCMSSSNCHSVYFDRNVCYMYMEQPTLTDKSGSVYSEKSCSGTSTDTVTVTEQCQGAGSRPLPRILSTVVAVILSLASR